MRKWIAEILKNQSIRYLAKIKAKKVVITGSVGKTSTTQAISTVLESKYKTIKTIGNYNTDIGVPCSIFERKIPNQLYNPFAWLIIFITNELKILNPKNTEVFVLELGTDKIGDIEWFKWLEPEVAVVTAIAPEHMEFFKTLDKVAEEELSVAEFSDTVFINKDLVDVIYLKGLDYHFYSKSDLKKLNIKPEELSVVGEHSLNSVVAAVTVGKFLGIENKILKSQAKKIKPELGRMNLLKGINKSVLIDDTYNSSPEAVKAALDYMYKKKAPQKIALLGNMNELGQYSKEAHIEIGEYCDPDKLDLVVTLGPDANKYTARAAKAIGCEVVEANHPHDAAEAIIQKMKPEALILLKGSQNNVYAEEATKQLLANPEDELKLVRQTVAWKEKKIHNLGKI